MGCRIIILALLAVSLLVSLPATLIGQTTRTIVSGQADFADGVVPAETDFQQWFDSGGRRHINNLIAQGNVTLTGDSINFTGKWVAVFSVFITDDQDSGRVIGPFRVTTTLDGQEITVWEGHYIGEGTNGVFVGSMWGVST